MTSFDLIGRRALVTGVSRGLGLAIADAFAAAGADIVGVSASLPETGSEAEGRVTAHGRRFDARRVDFADRAAVRALGTEFASGGIDVLVNNAGTIKRAPAESYPMEAWDRLLEVNLSSAFLLSQMLAGPMLKRGTGRILFTASLLSFQGGILVPGYTASKSAIGGLVKALANEWTAGGVTVNGIAPGYIATDNTEALRADPVRARAILDRIPAGRWGDPEDIAGAAVFLASPAARYVSGTILPVDGGWLGR